MLFSLMGTCANFVKELGIKVDSGEDFGISFKGTLKKMFGNKGDYGDLSREHGST